MADARTYAIDSIGQPTCGRPLSKRPTIARWVRWWRTFFTSPALTQTQLGTRNLRTSSVTSVDDARSSWGRSTRGVPREKELAQLKRRCVTCGLKPRWRRTATRREMAMASATTLKYLRLLGAPSPDEVADRVLGRIRAELARCGSSTPPIRLSRVAEGFQIQRRPERSKGSGRGSIVYNRERRRFVIALGFDDNGTQVRGGSGGAEIRGLRFVYAHEFAHRFLFVRSGDGWERALAQVAEAATIDNRLSVVRELSRIEERVCNSVASRVLMPRASLDPLIQRIIADAEGSPHLLLRVVRSVSEVFEVSWWCALRRLCVARPGPLSEAVGPSFCLLLLRRSSATGKGRGKTTLRVLDYWWPREVGGFCIKPGYPGILVSRLGPEFAERVANLERNGDWWGRVQWPMHLMSREGETVSSVLQGFWRVWGPEGSGGALLYGEAGLAKL